jgi:pimeloyl-ACP methyl ester carboxylesterase
MPYVTASDGVNLHWEERGSGPTVLLVPYWSMLPSIFDPIEAELSRDCRVIRYDERGTGKSERSGPYDMASGVSDLEAICEGVGPVDVAICLVDAANRAVRIADSRPELLRSVVCMGSAPFGPGALRGSDSLISSEAVVGAYLQQLEADPRSAVRAALAGANTNLSEDGLRDRVALQMDYIEPEATATRAREWATDEGGAEPGRRLGDRLHVLISHALGGPGNWFPAANEMEPIVRTSFPDAGVTWVSDGIVSAPDEAAAAVRDVLAGHAAAS